MREDPLVRWVCSRVVRCRTSGSQDGRYLRAMPICASGLVCSRCRRRCRDSRESRPGARRVSLPPRASAQLNAGVETATVDGMGCDGDGRETGFDGSTNSQVSTWRVPFQRRELDGGRQGVGTEFRGLWRVRGRRGQGECPGSGHCSRSMHWCTTASRLVSCAQLGKASRTTDGRRPPIGPPATAVFLDFHVPRKQPPLLHLFNDRSATWIRILIALNFLCLVNTMDEIKKQCPRVAISSHLLTQTR